MHKITTLGEFLAKYEISDIWVGFVERRYRYVNSSITLLRPNAIFNHHHYYYLLLTSQGTNTYIRNLKDTNIDRKGEAVNKRV